MAAPASSANAAPASSTRNHAEKPLTEQVRKVQAQDDEKMNYLPGGSESTPERPPVRKLRSLSDITHSPSQPPASPINRSGKDDSSLGTTPSTPHRPALQTHGLSLQVPAKLGGTLTPTPASSRVPLSPKLDSSHTYGSPASVLPRRSRGLDFSRASTNLHHSTLAEASPDSSPVVPGRGMNVPQRKPLPSSSALGSPSNTHGSFWAGTGHTERLPISSSMSSVNMLDSESSSSSDEDGDESITAFDRGDPMAMTPQAGKTGNNVFSTPCSPNTTQCPGGEWMGGFSAAKASLMNFQRARFGKVRSRHSSTSTSGNSPKQSPAPMSPPVVKSVEVPAPEYASKVAARDQVRSRRESLSLGTRDLHLSDISDEGEAKHAGVSSPSSGSLAGGSNAEGGRRGVVKRPVTRRGNLLPKGKNFARIRAALFEECTPVESEVKREAEVVRQVRESEPEVPPLSPPLISGGNPPVSASLGDLHSATTAAEAPDSAVGREASDHRGKDECLNSLGTRRRVPSASSELTESLKEALETETHASRQAPHDPNQSRFSTPTTVPSADAPDTSRNLHKRRRTDDLDVTSFKRRAVSPAMSVQSSPVLSQPPPLKDHHPSGPLPKNAGHPGLPNEGSNASTNTNPGHVKRVGMQGMNETNDGLMKMSID